MKQGKKWQDRRGETLVETLVSILIIVLTFVFLGTAAVSAAKINTKVRDTDVSFRYSEAAAGSQYTLRLKSADGQRNGELPVQLYQQNDYLYYTAVQEDTP